MCAGVNRLVEPLFFPLLCEELNILLPRWESIHDTPFEVNSRSHALILHFKYWENSRSGTADEQSLILEKITFFRDANLPFDLDRDNETPVTALLKLSRDTVRGEEQSISHFMTEGLVVEVAFGADFVGIQRVRVARLGAPIGHNDFTRR